MRRLCALLLPSLALAAAHARGETIERVVAKVNGQIITLSEFQSRQIAAAQAQRVDASGVSQFLRQNNARILQGAANILQSRCRQAGVRVQEQETFSPRQLGAAVHLPRPSGARLGQPDPMRGREFARAVRAPAIHDDDFIRT